MKPIFSLILLTILLQGCGKREVSRIQPEEPAAEPATRIEIQITPHPEPTPVATKTPVSPVDEEEPAAGTAQITKDIVTELELQDELAEQVADLQNQLHARMHAAWQDHAEDKATGRKAGKAIWAEHKFRMEQLLSPEQFEDYRASWIKARRKWMEANPEFTRNGSAATETTEW